MVIPVGAIMMPNTSVPEEVLDAARRVIDGHERGTDHSDSYDVAVSDLLRWRDATLSHDIYLLAKLIVAAEGSQDGTGIG
jgi:hypothetical protein